MIQNSNINKIAEIFFNEPIKNHYLLEISKKAKLAHTSGKNYINSLKKEGIIKEFVEKRGKRNFPIYIADIENKKYKKYKKIYNLNKILESGLVEFLRDKFLPKNIILFGSYAKGEDIETSDIDLFIEAKKQELPLKSFENKLKRKIELHFNEDFSNYSNELKNNIINGQILYGYLEVFK